MKRQATEWEKIFANNMTDNELNIKKKKQKQHFIQMGQCNTCLQCD